ncbi:MAG: SagB/ThcOx family dehydrogenase [Candidatus Bipolaricaulota bacterium]|nr:MAG: SagB/ThcOx family dehydrogenase [Candidatus Bipolaricaulota bacterium]
MMSHAGRRFVRDTCYDRLTPSDQAAGVPQPPLFRQRSAAPGEAITLPDPRAVPQAELTVTAAITRRESLRDYSPEPLSLEELSYLLWATQGLRGEIPGKATLRTVPSAGARHPLETFVLAHRVCELPPGLYPYLPLDHALGAAVGGADAIREVAAACLGQAIVPASAATFLWTAVPYRSAWRYSERAYRYLFLDAGHACQNLYLAAESIGAGACAIGAFSDEALNEALGVDGEEEFAIYAAAVGKRPRDL